MTIKRISLFGILFFLASVSITQAQIGSPYSMLGLGDVANPGFGQSKAMGGIGIGIRSSNHLNPINPAGYTALDSMSVIYEVGISGGYNYIQSASSSTTNSDGAIDYFAMGFKVKPFWGMGFGLTPSTRINYTLESETASSPSGAYSTYYSGSGGLSKIYWSNSFDVFSNLSLGISAGYVFGNINRVTSVLFQDYLLYTNHTKYQYTLNVHDFSFNYGLQYTAPINDKNEFVIGLVYENKMKMNTKSDIFGITTSGTEYKEGIDYDQTNPSTTSPYIVDTIVMVEDHKSTLTMPSKFGGSVTYYHKNNLIIGADVTMQKWSELETDEIDDVYKDALSYKGGMQWTPDANSINSYMKRIRYRFGGHYTQSHMVISDQRINDYGVSFGFGLPLRNSKTSFSISGELGQRGTTDQNLLKETYGIISLNLSLSDIWFFKRKYK